MDVHLHDSSGIEACRRIHDDLPGIPVAFLTSSPDEVDVLDAIVAEARSYVFQQTRSAELVRTVEALGRGESMLDPAVTGLILDRVRRLADGTAADADIGLAPR